MTCENQFCVATTSDIGALFRISTLVWGVWLYLHLSMIRPSVGKAPRNQHTTQYAQMRIRPKKSSWSFTSQSPKPEGLSFEKIQKLENPLTGPLPPSHFSGSGQSGGITAVARSPCHRVAGGCPVICRETSRSRSSNFPLQDAHRGPRCPLHRLFLQERTERRGKCGNGINRSKFPVSTLDEWSFVWICQTPRWPPPILVKKCLDFWKRKRALQNW